MALTLWGNGASRARVVHWMMHELGLAYEKRLIGPRTGETQTEDFLRLNPQGKVPVLEDGELVLTESAAIVIYLAETYGSGKHFVPAPVTVERAIFNQWCFFTMMELDAQSSYIVRKHTTLSYIYGEAPTAVEVARNTFLKQVGAVERELSDGRKWILPERFTAADMLITVNLLFAQSLDLVLPGRVAAYAERNTSREAFKASATVAGP